MELSAYRGRSQPADATLYLEGEMECGLMVHKFHRGFTAAEKTELWDRWKRGESLKAEGIHCSLPLRGFVNGFGSFRCRRPVG
jgi:hypothetical protein